jgi:hypothetical protein
VTAPRRRTVIAATTQAYSCHLWLVVLRDQRNSVVLFVRGDQLDVWDG